MMPREPSSADSFEEEIRQAVSYERSLAYKIVIPLALVAALIVIRLLGF
jgi:hypothetical protein